jgi:hypothetical protein
MDAIGHQLYDVKHWLLIVMGIHWLRHALIYTLM